MRIEDIEATIDLQEAPTPTPTAETASKRDEDVQPSTGLQVPTNTADVDPTLEYVAASSMSTRTPESVVVIPEIVIVAPPHPEDEQLQLGIPAEDSNSSVYSQDSLEGDHEAYDLDGDHEEFFSCCEGFDSEESVYSMAAETPELESQSGSPSPSFDSPPLETPPLLAQLPLSSSMSTQYLATDVKYYHPAAPSLAKQQYLMVPPPSTHAPRGEKVSDVSLVSGKTFTSQVPPKKRRQAAVLGVTGGCFGLGLSVDTQSGGDPQAGTTNRRKSHEPNVLDELVAEEDAWSARQSQELSNANILDELQAEEDAWRTLDEPEDGVQNDNHLDIDAITLPDGSPICPKLAAILKKYRVFNSSMDQERLHKELDSWVNEQNQARAVSLGEGESQPSASYITADDSEEELSNEHAYDYNHDLVKGYGSGYDHGYELQVGC